MPFSSGTYSPPSNSFAQPVTGTVISSTAWAATLADLATALSTAILKDGTQTLTGNISFGGFKITGLGAGSAAGNSLRYEQLFTTSAVALLGAMDWVKGADVASATTLNLTTATGNAVHVTGTTTITAATLGSGMWRLVIFDDALTLTNHATNNNLPGAANITTAAGDRALYWADGTTVYCVAYVKVTGKAVVESFSTAATQADQETGSSTTTVVTPGRQQYHPSAAKGWANCNFNGTTSAAYNVTSIIDSGAGDILVTWATDFSSGNYSVVASPVNDYTGSSATTFTAMVGATNTVAGVTQVVTSRMSDFAATDCTKMNVVAFGDQ